VTSRVVLSRVVLSRVVLSRVVVGQVISRVLIRPVMPGRVLIRPVRSTFMVSTPPGPGDGAAMSSPGRALPACAALPVVGCAESLVALNRWLR
jgi:hypothetical protein